MTRPDLVIRGGFLVDGSDRPGFEADVAVVGDRIAGVGRYDGPAGEVIDARGKLVTPGFIDFHTHLDAQITWDPLGQPSCWHGVTSVVMGNCGVGFAPCKESDRDYLVDLDRLGVCEPEVSHDFPTEARHLIQRAKGYDATIVNGTVLMRDGVHTGAHPGRVLQNEAVA